MSSTPHHTHSHSMPQMQAASSSPPHLREYAASHRPGSSMSISSMLGTDTDSARPRPSLPPPISASQTSPITNGHNSIDRFRNWNENRNNRAYNGLPPRPFSSATYADPPRFGPALPNLGGQSPTRNTVNAEAHSPTSVSYDYRRTSAPPYEIPRAGMQEEMGRHATSTQSHAGVQEPRYNPNTRPPRILEQPEPSALSPVKQFPESDIPTPSYPFLSKTTSTNANNSTSSTAIPPAPAALPANSAQPAAARMIAQRSLDSRSERQSSSPELSRNPRENGLRSLQEIRRDSAGTPDPLSTPRGSPLLRRSFAVMASGGEDGDKKMIDMYDDKRGRSSPLPQAVQGAQAQSKGPTNEPGIKNEFARMFSGIGSGVGSAVSTPVPQEAQLPGSIPDSPPDRDDRGTPLGRKGDVDSKHRDSSRVITKRQRRDDTVKHEEDAGISLARTLSGRGQKRTRNNYQNVGTPLAQPHHHHHIHHHHHVVDGARPRRTTPVQANATASAAPHHHHHHHYHHHHHSAKPAVASQIRRPQILVNSRPVLDPVRYRPRYHLGSMLYQSKISAPTGDSGEEEAKLGFIATPVTIPKFEDKENCTFTVRIARTFLQKTARLEICERRFLWGTEVYSDDSDPIAVAIHSGWLQGAWDDTVDPSLQSSDDTDPANAQAAKMAKSSETTITILEKPSIPMLPIPGRDLHVTLVLLPRLQSYGSTVSHGIKSREWKAKHDGVSYRIEKIAWVDEGLSRGEERGGEARRRRLNATLDLYRDCRPSSRISTSFASKMEIKTSAPPVEVATTATLTP